MNNITRDFLRGYTMARQVSFAYKMSNYFYYRLFLLLGFFSINFCPLWGQNNLPQEFPVDMTATIVASYTQKMDSLKNKYRSWRIDNNTALANPYYHILFNGTSLYSMPYHRVIGRRDYNNNEKASHCLLGGSRKNNFELVLHKTTRTKSDLSKKQQELLERVCCELTHSYGNSPWLVKNVLDTGVENTGIDTEQPQEISHVVQEDNSQKELSPKFPIFAGDDTEDSKLIVVRPNFWTFKSDFALQFMQTYISKNWYKGGESNFSLLGNIILEANYNNKQKLAFDNKLEMKLGFQESRSDTYHKFKSNTDLLRLTNKLGYRAASHWYYTIMLQSWTQFYPSYKSNDPQIYSAFMSPFETLLSFGMDYKLEKKSFTMNLTLSPLAVNFKYVKRGELAQSFGIDEGKHTLFKFGSNVTGTFKWDISKNISWGSRIYFFSDYKTIQAEWENTINFRVNRYFSTTLFVYPRFDNAVEIQDNGSYFQLNEHLSIGLNFTI